MVKRVSEDARRAVLTAATAEAQRMGDRRIGTHHLLLALLDNPLSLAARLLAVDLAAARSALTHLERAALTTIGVEAPVLDRPQPIHSHRRPPFTSGARSTLHEGVDHARAEGSPQIEERHILHALLARKQPDPAAELLATLGIDTRDALHRLSEDRC
jgi:ATP-dependent Clp protease ATP-binding subunit ClpA